MAEDKAGGVAEGKAGGVAEGKVGGPRGGGLTQSSSAAGAGRMAFRRLISNVDAISWTAAGLQSRGPGFDQPHA